jgi:hypothetical protein
MCGHFRGNWSSTSNYNRHQSEIDRTESIKYKLQEYDRICRVDPTTRQLVDGYARLVIDRVDRGWSCHLMTFPFCQLPGPRGAVIQAMKDELHRVYSTFVTRTNRKPRTASPDELPILIGTADLQVYKRDPASSPLVVCNGGLHFHGLLLVPPRSRLRVPVEEHFRDGRDVYLGKRRLIRELDVRPVTETHGRAVDYVFKAILRGRVSYDEGILLLPRSRGELAPARKSGTGSLMDPVFTR